MKALFYSPDNDTVTRIVEVAQVDMDEVDGVVYCVRDPGGGTFQMDEGLTVVLVEDDWEGELGDPAPKDTKVPVPPELLILSPMEKKMRNLIKELDDRLKALEKAK